MTDPADTTFLFGFLGAPGSGRRAVLAHLLSERPDTMGQVLVLLSNAEDDDPANRVIENLPGVTLVFYPPAEGPAAVWPAQAAIADVPGAAVFVVADGRSDPVTQIELWKNWLDTAPLDLGRIFTIFHCRLLHDHPEAWPWFEACAHFSDVILLNRRENIPNKWMSDLRHRFEKQHTPSLIEFVKQNRVEFPESKLIQEWRRLSQLFDPADEIPDLPGIQSGEGPSDDLPWEDYEDEAGATHRVADHNDRETAWPGADEDWAGRDPYLERLPSGHLIRPLPDIRRFLTPST